MCLGWEPEKPKQGRVSLVVHMANPKPDRPRFDSFKAPSRRASYVLLAIRAEALQGAVATKRARRVAPWQKKRVGARKQTPFCCTEVAQKLHSVAQMLQRICTLRRHLPLFLSQCAWAERDRAAVWCSLHIILFIILLIINVIISIEYMQYNTVHMKIYMRLPHCAWAEQDPAAVCLGPRQKTTRQPPPAAKSAATRKVQNCKAGSALMLL